MSSVFADGSFNFHNVTGGLPIHIPCEISKIMCILKPVIHSGDVRHVLLTLKYRVVSFRTQNKILLLSSAPPIRLTSPFLAQLHEVQRAIVVTTVVRVSIPVPLRSPFICKFFMS